MGYVSVRRLDFETVQAVQREDDTLWNKVALPLVLQGEEDDRHALQVSVVQHVVAG